MPPPSRTNGGRRCAPPLWPRARRNSRLALAAAELGCWSWDEAADRLAWDAQAAAILGSVPRRPGRPGGAAGLRRSGRPGVAGRRDQPRPPQWRTGALHRPRWRAAPGIAPRWIELRAQATAGLGCPTWHGVIADITERRRTEEQQRLLLREVDHRAKNTLAVVQALLRLTRTEDPGSFLPRVEARIAALARAHTLLAQARWQGVALRRLAEAELGRHAAPTTLVSLAGPSVMLAATATQPMAMVLHELASNAARYGALGQPGGTLSLPGGWHWPAGWSWSGRNAWLRRRPTTRRCAGSAPASWRRRCKTSSAAGSRATDAGGLHCVIRLPPSSCAGAGRGGRLERFHLCHAEVKPL